MTSCTLVTSAEWLYAHTNLDKVYWYGTNKDKKHHQLAEVVVRETTKTLARVEFTSAYNGELREVQCGTLKWVPKSQLRLPR